MDKLPFTPPASRPLPLPPSLTFMSYKQAFVRISTRVLWFNAPASLVILHCLQSSPLEIHHNPPQTDLQTIHSTRGTGCIRSTHVLDHSRLIYIRLSLTALSKSSMQPPHRPKESLPFLSSESGPKQGLHSFGSSALIELSSSTLGSTWTLLLQTISRERLL